MLSRNIGRIGVLAGISVLVLGSASSRQPTQPAQPGGMTQAPAAGETPPAAQDMPPEYAHGFWESSFGAVRIDRDTRVANPEAVTGTWTYNRGGQYVTGYFAGNLRGNILDFAWTEPLQPPLNGTGFIVFDTGGTSFSGSWATNTRDRSGTWTGWRAQPSNPTGEQVPELAIDPGPPAQPAPPNDPGASTAPLAPMAPTAPPAQPYYPAQPAPQPYYPAQPAPQPYYPAPQQPSPNQPVNPGQ